jgi:hypothetical protein
LIGLLVVVAAGVGAVLASWFMWWASRRSALWTMAAGLLLTVMVFAIAVIVAWLVTRALYGP